MKGQSTEIPQGHREVRQQFAAGRVVVAQLTVDFVGDVSHLRRHQFAARAEGQRGGTPDANCRLGGKKTLKRLEFAVLEFGTSDPALSSSLRVAT